MTGFAIGIAAACIAATVWWLSSLRLRSPWVRAAQRLGLEERGASLVGRIEGHHVEVHVPRSERPVGEGPTASLHCRLSLPMDLGLSIRPLSVKAAGHDHGDQVVASGDSDFDTSFASFADEAVRAGRLLSNREMLAAVVALTGVEEDFCITDDGVHLELRGGTMASERLGGAVDSALAVVEQIERIRHDLPVAIALSEHRREWAAVASALGLELSTTPLAVAGLLDGIRVAARVERFGYQNHGLVVTATFDEPLALGLTVVPRPGRRRRSSDDDERRRRRRPSFSKLFDEEEHRARVRFRRTFDVRADEVWAADHFLHQAVQEALLALHSQYGSISLSDDALRVEQQSLPRSRVPLEDALHRVAVAGRIIGHGIGGAAHDSRGPYR
jgi:hypothetical protein